MQNERVERDLYWTRVRAYEFYQEMIRRGFMFEERPNEAINVLVDDAKSPSSEPQESSRTLTLCFKSDGLFQDTVWFARPAHALDREESKKQRTSKYGKLILDLGNEVLSSVDQGTAVMEKLVESLSAHMTKVVIHRMIKESIDVAVAAERARQANVRNDASGSGPVRGQDTAPDVRECTFAGFMKCNPTIFHGVEGAVKLRRWFKKTESVFEISECAEGRKVKFVAATLEGPALTWCKTKVETMGLETVKQIPWTEMKQLMTTEFCSIEEVQRIEHELWNLKVKEYDVVAYTQRFNELALICPRMGEVTSSKPDDLNEAVRMAHKLMEQKSQARDEKILEGKKQKWESFQSGNSSGKGNQKDNFRQTLQNSQKQGNARAMVTAPIDRKLPLCERCFTRHVGQCTIKCHKCGKVGHKVRNRCPKKIKQEEVGEVRGRAYAIKDAESKGPNVVTGMFMLNNRYAFVLFDSGSDRSFVDTRFSSMLDIDLVKIGDSYEVELANGRVVSANTFLKGCILNLVNHIFEIDLMPIELVKHDAVIVCGEKVVRILYGSKTLIVEGGKGVSRPKVISCIKARKYVERGCHLFLAHMIENKSKEKQMEDVPVIRDFPEVFPEELPGLPPSRQVEF
ncbi:putative reverse transcriptase domain-containing protein [Tanacetum coccineum]